MKKQTDILQEAQKIVDNCANKRKKILSPTEFFSANERVLDLCIICMAILLGGVIIKLFSL